MRLARVLALSSILAFSGIVAALAAPLTSLATCSANHITLYVDANGGGSGAQSFCLEGGNNLPNLNNIPGPCPQFLHANSWNDCVSSVRVSVASTQCIATYSNANYSTVMTVYWGPDGPDHLYNVSPNDAMSSIKQYTKTPATPAGNC